MFASVRERPIGYTLAVTAGSPDNGDQLQFDRVEPTQPGPADATPPGVVCAACRQAISAEYFAAGAAPICATCKQLLDDTERASRTWTRFVRAFAFGTIAAIAGAILYYAVAALANLEIGIVAIAIGYMVGYAVIRGAGGRGGRRYQVLALVLTYSSVGLAYLPIAVNQAGTEHKASTAATSTTAQPATPPRPEPSFRGLIFALAALLAISLALPVLVVVGSFPSGLISAVIIGVGMRQAWRMTAAPNLTITGPYRVGAAAPMAT
jgi:hypothetical protein